mgnify:CR=1 FL=1
MVNGRNQDGMKRGGTVTTDTRTTRLQGDTIPVTRGIQETLETRGIIVGGLGRDQGHGRRIPADGGIKHFFPSY